MQNKTINTKKCKQGQGARERQAFIFDIVKSPNLLPTALLNPLALANQQHVSKSKGRGEGKLKIRLVVII